VRNPGYLHAGKIIGHLGCSGFEFYDAAKLLPNYDKLKYENAVRDLTVYAKREQGQYELHANAKKILRIIIGPAPDDPEYAAWWRGRLISVRQMREQGQPVEWAEEPPIPLPEQTLVLGMGAGRVVPDWDPAQGRFLPVTEANLTLSFDHRVLDGGAAGRLLARIAALLARPADL